MSTGKTEWSTWIELAFNANGTLDTTALNRVPRGSGVYAIASKKSTGLYVTHYVGRSSRNIHERLQRHLSGRGNKVVASQMMLKRSIPSAPGNNICVAYLETKEPKIVEAVYLDTRDLPVCNLVRARLPPGISQALLWGAELER